MWTSISTWAGSSRHCCRRAFMSTTSIPAITYATPEGSLEQAVMRHFWNVRITKMPDEKDGTIDSGYLVIILEKLVIYNRRLSLQILLFRYGHRHVLVPSISHTRMRTTNKTSPWRVHHATCHPRDGWRRITALAMSMLAIKLPAPHPPLP